MACCSKLSQIIRFWGTSANPILECLSGVSWGGGQLSVEVLRDSRLRAGAPGSTLSMEDAENWASKPMQFGWVKEEHILDSEGSKQTIH